VAAALAAAAPREGGDMNFRRIVRHLASTDRQLRRAFPAHTLAAIQEAIRHSEAEHSGQLRFVVEGALDGAPLWRDQSPRDRALELFAHLRIWDTEHNSGVLVYLLLADHAVEIVVDRGIHACCDSGVWQRICRSMESQFAAGRFEAGTMDGIAAVSHLLMRHFPPNADGRNELPDSPLLL